ncbi:MAG: hypothetical protein Q7R22_004405 [Verrucomicrobiota bacterium JB025]|nr:hypothetical protein [Verrucomicrobiota bacterium JB025]
MHEFVANGGALAAGIAMPVGGAVVRIEVRVEAIGAEFGMCYPDF